MSTYQYIHPSCNMKEEAEYTHIQRSVDTNTFNPMVHDLKSDLVPLTFNYNAEIKFPLGMCNNRLLQIGPIREDHKEEQFWNNFQFKRRYPKHYNKKYEQSMFQLRKDNCGEGGRRGCTATEQKVYKDYMYNGVDKSKANVAGGIAEPIHSIAQRINNNVI